jgi:hypothetical protein
MNGKLKKKSKLAQSRWRRQKQSTPKKAALFPKCIDIFTIAYSFSPYSSL